MANFNQKTLKDFLFRIKTASQFQKSSSIEIPKKRSSLSSKVVDRDQYDNYGAINFSSLGEGTKNRISGSVNLEARKTTNSFDKHLANNSPIFYRINRETIDFKGFECHMITLRQEFINLESKLLRKKIRQQEFILPAVAHEMRAPIGIT